VRVKIKVAVANRPSLISPRVDVFLPPTHAHTNLSLCAPPDHWIGLDCIGTASPLITASASLSHNPNPSSTRPALSSFPFLTSSLHCHSQLPHAHSLFSCTRTSATIYKTSLKPSSFTTSHISACALFTPLTPNKVPA